MDTIPDPTIREVMTAFQAEGDLVAKARLRNRTRVLLANLLNEPGHPDAA